MRRLLIAALCGLLFVAPAWSQVTPTRAAVLTAPKVAAAASAIADVIWTTRGVTQLGLTNSGHTVTLSPNFPGFADGVVLANTSFANGDKRFWGMKVEVFSANGDIETGPALSSVGTTPATLAFSVANNGRATGSTGGNTFGPAVGTNPMLVVWDGPRQAYFLYYAGFGWFGSSGTDSPTGGTGGAIPSSAIGTPLFPALQLVDANDKVTINGGAQAFDPSLTAQVAALKAAGFKELGAP